jgi:uncharacterized Zn-binding protein involved in type VI secretion
MPGPAARVGDSTAHGGVIIPPGCPTVLIGGMPAARVTDMQVCPMVTPAPAPVPHVSGPISGPGVPTVLIGGMPAATIGDITVCVGPPGTIIVGCPTVLIGTGGGGSGSASGGAANAARDGAHSALVGDQVEGEGPHWKDIQFVDKAGNPITQVPYELTGVEGQKEKYFLTKDGKIKRGNLPNAGQYTVQLFSVYNAKWSQNEARVGDVVKLTANVEGYRDGTKALFVVWERDMDGKDDFIVQIKSKVKGGEVETEWKYEYHEDEDDIAVQQLVESYRFTGEEDKNKGYSSPEYYFIVTVGQSKSRSSLIRFKDWIEIRLTDTDDNPIANASYRFFLSNGEMRSGTLDSNGYKKIENVPPGKWSAEFPDYPWCYCTGD